MPAGDFHLYNGFKLGQYEGSITNLPADLNATDAIRCAFVTNSYLPNTATHQDWADVSANEVSSTGTYPAGGETMTFNITESGGTVTVDAENVVVAQDATNGFTNARYIVLYVYNATAANAPLIGYGELGADKGNTTGSLTIQWAPTGIWNLSGAN